MKKITFIKIIALIVFVCVIALFWNQVDLALLTDRERIRAIVEESFVKGALLYIGTFVAIKFTFSPMTPMTVLGGYVFGGLWGATLGTIAITLSSVLMFVLARLLGENFVRQTIDTKSTRLSRYNDLIERHGFVTVIFFRIIPIAPLAVVNFGLGITKVKLRDFVLGTILGTMPGNLLLAFIGDNADRVRSPQFIVLVIIYLLFLGITSWYAYRKRS